jgi:hypothetical protein
VWRAEEDQDRGGDPAAEGHVLPAHRQVTQFSVFFPCLFLTRQLFLTNIYGSRPVYKNTGLRLVENFVPRGEL